MKKLFLLLCIVSFFSCSKKVHEKVQPKERIDRLYNYLEGSYTNKTQAKEDEDIAEYVLHIASIWKQFEGEHWLYIERRNLDEPNVPIYQRVLKLVESMDFLKQQIYHIPTPGRYEGAWEQVALLDSIGPSDLRKQNGCTLYFKEAEVNNFKGITLGKSCVNRFKGASYARVDMNVQDDKLRWLEQGFDEKNQFMWGPEGGGIEFIKTEAGNAR